MLGITLALRPPSPPPFPGALRGTAPARPQPAPAPGTAEPPPRTPGIPTLRFVTGVNDS